MENGYHHVTSRTRRFTDHAAKRLITLAGIGIILSISAIFVFIGSEVLPLLRGAEGQTLGSFPATEAGNVRLVAADEYRENAFVVRSDGRLVTIRLRDGVLVGETKLVERGEVRSASYDRDRGSLALGLDTGEVVFWRVNFVVTFEGDRRVVRLEATPEGAVPLAEGRPVALLSEAGTAGSRTVAASLERGGLVLYRRTEQRTPLGETRVEESHHDLGEPQVAVSALVLSSDGRRLFAGTADGLLLRWTVAGGREPVHDESVRATRDGGVSVSALSFLIGDRTLVVGDSSGEVSGWLSVRDPASPSGWRTTRVHELQGHSSPVRTIAPSERGKSFLTADDRGEVRLHHSTSGQTLLHLAGSSEPIDALFFAPKADGAVGIDRHARLLHWRIDNPHPEITVATLFGKIWYEGYERPEFVWQSTGGTDDFEAKFSLTPLAFGTLKGTFYALLFAVPIAILAALYTSQFLRPAARGAIKPVIEIMAALPSVVLGFLAGLWLAPLVEGIVPGILLTFAVVPLTLVLGSALWQLLPERIRVVLPLGSELLLLIPLVVAGIWASIGLGGWVESWAFGGDFSRWLYESTGERYDQRNSLVVGFAMGFAVIPIIFTIAEDSLSNVPQRLVSASLALGATPWQTAVRVVLPTASPGIFSATMIGFGRAVGETMIVLMATGNTPIMDASIFNGFRALSANIAVEIPEAPFGGTLYRVLFLAALLLFLTTFLVNTAAEIVRLRLRKRYARL